MKINLAALDELDNRYQMTLAERIETPTTSNKMADLLEANGIKFHQAIEEIKSKAVEYGMAIADDGPDPLGEALNSGDGVYRP